MLLCGSHAGFEETAKHGEIQTNAADRKKLADDKRKQIFNYLSKYVYWWFVSLVQLKKKMSRRYYVNPKTMKPHPLVHLENAWVAAKIKIDLDEPVEMQVKR